MKRVVVSVLLVAFTALVGVSQVQRSDASVHVMRVYGVMAGASGDPDVQYVELRMAAAGQTQTDGTYLCFYDVTGSAYARFEFTANVTAGANGSSILVGTSEFDAAWAAGSPDFLLGANTVAIAGGADTSHPVRSPGGKVSFGIDSAAIPAADMCQASFSVIDSVAYGTGYSGTVDFGTKLNADLTITGTDAVRLQGPVCFPIICTRDNSTDYDASPPTVLTDVNVPGDHPRNNAGTTGPLSVADPTFDVLKDFIPDSGASVTVSLACDSGSVSPASASSSEGAPATFTVTGASGDPDCTATESPIPAGYQSSGSCAAALLAVGECTITNSLDSDGDGVPDDTDNCPAWPNPGQSLPPWSVPPGDDDCDSFSSATETVLGTDPDDACGFTAGAPAQSETWPPDLVESNGINISDVLALKPVFGTSVPPTSARLDLVVSNSINISDVLSLKPFFGATCTP